MELTWRKLVFANLRSCDHRPSLFSKKTTTYDGEMEEILYPVQLMFWEVVDDSRRIRVRKSKNVMDNETISLKWFPFWRVLNHRMKPLYVSYECNRSHVANGEVI